MKKIIITILSVVFVLCIGVGICIIIFSPSQNKATNNVDDEQIIDENIPQIFCDDISLYVGQSNAIQYNIIYEDEYTVSFSSTFDCINFENNDITLTQSGEYNFDINVTANQNTYSKNVKVYSYQNITDATYNFYNLNDQIVDKLFVGDTYKLQINANSKIMNSNLVCSDNLQLLNCENINNKLLITLKVNEYDDINISLNCFNFSKHITVDLYCYIEDFDISFGTQNLYLFNQNFIQQANSDNKYSVTTFEVAIDEKFISDYDINLSCENVITIEQNTITAIGKGQCEITFSAKDGSEYVEKYTITVEEINIDTIEFAENNVELLKNESYFVEYSYSPIYAICDLHFDKVLDNGYISFDTVGQYTLVLTDNISQKTCTLNISVTENLSYKYELHFNQSFLDEYLATYQNNVLTLTGKENTQITFDYNIVSNYTGNIASDILILNNNSNMEIESQNISNAIILTTSDKGSFDLKITLHDNPNVTYTLRIVIN